MQPYLLKIIVSTIIFKELYRLSLLVYFLKIWDLLWSKELGCVGYSSLYEVVDYSAVIYNLSFLL